MKSFQRRWKGLEITIVAVLVLLLLLLAYLNWAIAILALIIVVAAYLVNYNTLHNRRPFLWQENRKAQPRYTQRFDRPTMRTAFQEDSSPLSVHPSH